MYVCMYLPIHQTKFPPFKSNTTGFILESTFPYLYSEKSCLNHHQRSYLFTQYPLYITSLPTTTAESSALNELLTFTLTHHPKSQTNKQGEKKEEDKSEISVF